MGSASGTGRSSGCCLKMQGVTATIPPHLAKATKDTSLSQTRRILHHRKPEGSRPGGSCKTRRPLAIVMACLRTRWPSCSPSWLARPDTLCRSAKSSRHAAQCSGGMTAPLDPLMCRFTCYADNNMPLRIHWHAPITGIHCPACRACSNRTGSRESCARAGQEQRARTSEFIPGPVSLMSAALIEPHVCAD
eukprot:SAG31_NODE_4054_length_3633_cov_1.767402_2_plen_191_part_00